MIESRYWEQIEVSGGRVVERIYRLRLKESVLSVQEIARVETGQIAAWGRTRLLKLTLKNEKILYLLAFAGAEELHLIAAKLDEVVRAQQEKCRSSGEAEA